MQAARTVLLVAAAGSAAPRIAVLLIVATAIRTSAANIWDSACSVVQVDIYPCFELARLWRGLEIYLCNEENATSPSSNPQGASSGSDVVLVVMVFVS